MVNGCRTVVLPRGRPATLRLLEPLIPVPRARSVPDCPSLRLVAEVLADAVNLVRGVRRLNEAASMVARRNPQEIAAARRWISRGDVGVVTFDAACEFLGMDAERTRRAILSGFARRAGDVPAAVETLK
jgi:hypothetical protein